MKSLAATVLLVLGTALAEDDLAALVRDLGSEDFAARDAASRRLTEVGEPARALLEKARSSPDAEVQMRAGRILAILDVRRRIETEYEEASRSFGGDSHEDAARRVWLGVLRAAARGEAERIGGLFVAGSAPKSFWESARNRPLSALADLSWVEVAPSRYLGWMEGCDEDVVVLGAVPEWLPDRGLAPDALSKELRALVLAPAGGSWKVTCELPSTALDQLSTLVAQGEAERREWAAGQALLRTLGSKRAGVACYDLAQTLDGVGDFEGALRAFERGQPTGVWPDYCIVHRYIDLMRLGRRGDAARVLREEPGGGSCEYMGKVIHWLRGELKTEGLIEYAEGQGSYTQESVHYYLGMERLLAGDVERAKEHLSRCAEHGGGCYEQTFAADALWLLDRPERPAPKQGEGH